MQPGENNPVKRGSCSLERITQLSVDHAAWRE